ncbi:MAG: hypothetical protein WKF97_04935 [Chitinophagaceae bacterium]
MIKRIAFIAVLSGTGQLLSIFVLKYISQRLPVHTMNSLAQLDALFQLLLNLIALGLQSSAMRNITLSREWKVEYLQTQSARLTLALLLSMIGLFSFIDWEYCLFFIAPILALNGDYALYALGKPVKGAFIGFIRIVVPYSLLLITTYLKPEAANAVFLGSWVIIYLITNILINSYLKVDIKVRPEWKHLQLYLKSLPLGAVSLSFYFLGLGLLLIVPYFYPPVTGTIAFMGLKFYVIFKGVLRIIHQAFLKEMTSTIWCLKVDELSMLIGMVLLGSVLIYPESFITLFFGKQFIPERSFFTYLGIAALLYSFVLSTTTRALLEKKDLPYTVITLIAAVMALACTIVISFWSPRADSIAISICVGELALVAGLIYIAADSGLLKPRLRFLLFNSVLFAIPLGFRCILADNLLWYITSFGLLALALAFLHRNTFKLFTEQ